MKNATGTFAGHDNSQLYYQTWTPDQAPRAVLAVVHGVGEHSDRYKNLVDCLLPEGYAIASYDHRGHGRSSGQRGHIHSWNDYRLDADNFLKQVRQDFPALPLFIYGHSMGSLVVLDYIEHHPEGFKGVIISGTAIQPTDAAPPATILMAKVLSGVFPKMTLKMPIDGSALSRDPQAAKAYNEDPLVHSARSVRWGAESIKIITSIKSRASEIKLPILFVHGEADQVVSAAGAKDMYAMVSSPDKTLKIYPGGKHEPHNDTCHPELAADISQWLAAHL
jgi:alpha-beta hydrolase superfamily lysophospholipase